MRNPNKIFKQNGSGSEVCDMVLSKEVKAKYQTENKAKLVQDESPAESSEAINSSQVLCSMHEGSALSISMLV